MRMRSGRILRELASKSRAVTAGAVGVRRPPRQVERRRSPLVETAPPEAEDRSVRLGQLLKRARSAALVSAGASEMTVVSVRLLIR